MDGQFYYRYVDPADRDDPIVLLQLPVISHTPKGVWVKEFPWWLGDDAPKKFVNDSTVKRYAYPTVELAKAAYLARKKRQVSILSGQLQFAQELLAGAREDRFQDVNGDCAVYEANPFPFTG